MKKVSILLRKQFDFSNALSCLIDWTEFLGYGVTMGDTWSKPEYNAHSKKSVHYDRLAADLNLFKTEYRDGVMYAEYLGGGDEAKGVHTELHDIWDDLGGAPRIVKDLNHYSFKHNGRW